VTHDRYFLDNVAGWILELDRGAGIPWEGNYSSWLDQKRKRLEGEEKAESARQRTLANELEWVRASPRARQAKTVLIAISYFSFALDNAAYVKGGVQAHIGVYVSSAVSIEGGVLGARPHVTTQLSGDAESAPDLTADETLTRLIIDGSVLFHFTGASFGGGRGVPFVFGGGGYLRDAHEKNEVIDTGHEYHAGAGLHYWTGQGKHRLGIRADGGLSWRTGGADFSGTTRAVPTITASIAYLF
jgi:hypothetical protein